VPSGAGRRRRFLGAARNSVRSALSSNGSSAAGAMGKARPNLHTTFTDVDCKAELSTGMDTSSRFLISLIAAISGSSVTYSPDFTISRSRCRELVDMRGLNDTCS